MQWKLLGLIRLIHAQGPDVSCSAAGRAAAEAVWVPTALLPRFGVTCEGADAHHITASYRLDGFQLEVDYTLDDDARMRSVVLDRWSDPASPGTFGVHRFGHERTGYSIFDGVMMPSAGRAGWFYGTDRWSEGEFFRYEFTELPPGHAGQLGRVMIDTKGGSVAHRPSPCGWDAGSGPGANAVPLPLVLDVIGSRPSCWAAASS